jgi:tetratricopeptide (TPR) repeat protein
MPKIHPASLAGWFGLADDFERINLVTIMGRIVNLFKYNSNDKTRLGKAYNSVQKSPDDLLTEATARKMEGDLEGAITLLKEAYKEIGKCSIVYSVETFLRLPLYLQKAKRTDEAWEEFNVLLIKGYPNQLKNLEIIPMEHCSIYDKMRLLLQREGKTVEAIKYGIFSYLSWAIGLYRQNRIDELTDYLTKENYEKAIKTLLKKAKKEVLFNRICIIVREQIDSLPNIDFVELSKKLEIAE